MHAAKGLGKLPVDVTVVDRRNHHTFQPLLYQVALAVLSPADIAQPIRSILRSQQKREVLMDEVVGIDTAARGRWCWPAARRCAYDYLVLATGATHSYFGQEEWAKLAPGLKTMEDAHRDPPPRAAGVRAGRAADAGARLASAAEFRGHRRRADRRGAGRRHPRHLPSTTCATTSGRSTRQRPGCCCSTAANACWPPIPRIFPPRRRTELARLGVEVHTGCHVTAVGPGWVETGGPEDGRMDAAVTLWAAGVQASPLGKLLGVPTGPPRVRRWWTTSSIRRECPEVFVLGDLAHLEQDGKQVPGVAQPAMQMGDHVAKMLGRRPGRTAAPPRSATSTRATWLPSAAWTPWPGRVAVQGAHERLSRLGHLADGAHLLFDRLPQPVVGVCGLDVDLFHVYPRRTADHRRPAAARLAGPVGRRAGGEG